MTTASPLVKRIDRYEGRAAGFCANWPIGWAALLFASAVAGNERLENLPLSGFVDATSLEALADIVVTDTKVAQGRDTVTQNIVVLTAEELERQPLYNRNIAEFLRYTSGQFVNVLSRNDANWGSYAGLGPKYNSYLLDGLPIDTFVDPMSLDPWAFERIEAHKGPASVLYSNYLSMDFAGNEAPLAGTTNLILKERIDHSLTRVQVGYGSYDTVGGRAYHQGRYGDLSYFVGASEEVSDYRYIAPGNSWLHTLDSPNYEKTKVYGKASYAFGRNDHTLSIFAHYTLHQGDLGRPNRDFDHDYGTFNIAYSNQLTDAWQVQVKAGERLYNRHFVNDDWPASTDLVSVEKIYQRIRPLDLTVSYRHLGDSLLTVGFDRQTVDYRTQHRLPGGLESTANAASAESLGFYLQEKLQWQDWVLRAGVRHTSLEHDYELLGGKVPAVAHKSWSTTLWSAGLRYNLAPELSFYANAGSSFMAPAAKQIGGTVSAPVDSGNLPNPSLSPEMGVGKDFGVDWRPWKTLSLGARAFHNEIASAIVDNVVSAIPSRSIATNAGDATAMGIELDVRHTPIAGLLWFANLTLTHTEVENSGHPDEDGTAIPFAPLQVANLGVSAHLPGDVIASPYFHWVGRYWDSTSRSTREAFGNYGLLNLRLQRELLRSQTSAVNLTLDLNNLANQHYDMPFGFRDIGFNAYAAVDLSF